MITSAFKELTFETIAVREYPHALVLFVLHTSRQPMHHCGWHTGTPQLPLRAVVNFFSKSVALSAH